MKSFRDRNPYAVGLVSVLIIGALTGLAFMVGLLNLLEDTYEMEATFTDAAGLRTGDEIKVAGVKVGRVTGIEADRQHGLVNVTWVVNRGVDIGEEAGADIALETLLGAKYIRITNAAGGDRLMADLPREERVIPHEECDADGVCQPRTTTPVDVFDLTREATERIEETDNAKLNQLITQLTEITEGKRGTVTDLVEGIDQVATAINEREGELADLLDSKDQTLVQLIDSSKTILDFLSQRRAELAQALGDGSDAVRALSVLIETNRANLDAVLDDLHPTLAVVDARLPELNRALAVVGPAFFGQAQAGTHGPWLDIYVASLGPDIIGVLGDAVGAAP